MLSSFNRFYCFFLLVAISINLLDASTQNQGKIDWVSFSDVYPCPAKGEKKKLPKKIIIDFYTNWCGWCKVLEKKTLRDPRVLSYIKKHFYTVKFNTEKFKEPICYKDFRNRYDVSGNEVTPWHLLENTSYKYMKRAEVHSFAVFLMQNQITYPTLIVLDEMGDTFLSIKGYRSPEEFLKILKSIVNYNPETDPMPHTEADDEGSISE